MISDGRASDRYKPRLAASAAALRSIFNNDVWSVGIGRPVREELRDISDDDGKVLMFETHGDSFIRARSLPDDFLKEILDIYL